MCNETITIESKEVLAFSIEKIKISVQHLNVIYDNEFEHTLKRVNSSYSDCKSDVTDLFLINTINTSQKDIISCDICSKNIKLIRLREHVAIHKKTNRFEIEHVWILWFRGM